MRIGGRGFGQIIAAIGHREHYVAALNMCRYYRNPWDAFGRYFFNRGQYPALVTLSTPIGPVDLTVFSQHDVLTVNEIFCRNDYQADAGDRVVIDFGSNIGISAAYFLTRSEHSFVYLYEPLGQNVERLRLNLAPFTGRYELHQEAVYTENGRFNFGYEASGRYGGLGRSMDFSTTVSCVDANEVIASVLARHDQIDVLKIDIETMGAEIVQRIPPEAAGRIRTIYVEDEFPGNPLAATHEFRQRLLIARLSLRASQGS